MRGREGGCGEGGWVWVSWDACAEEEIGIVVE